MRDYRLLNHLPLRCRLYLLLNHPHREHPVTNGKSAETPIICRDIWKMRDMRSKLTLYHPQQTILKKTRRVNYSVDPVNEGAQSSTSVPSEGESLGNVVDVDPISRPHYEPIDMTTVGLRISKRRKSEKKKCYSTIKYIGFTAYCAFASMTTAVRGQIATISASRDLQNVQRAHSNVDWTRNICQPMALITAMISKYTLTYGEMKQQPDKPQFITAMQKEITDHEQRKH